MVKMGKEIVGSKTPWKVQKKNVENVMQQLCCQTHNSPLPSCTLNTKEEQSRNGSSSQELQTESVHI